MTISLGKAVLEIATDNAPLDKGLAAAKGGLLSFGAAGPAAMAPFAAAAAAATAAVAAIAAGVIVVGKEILELGQRGAMITDVRNSFEALSSSAGQTADVMLGALRKGTASTVTDFELMKAANKAMGAGLVATAGDFETLAAGARLLANRTGGETVEAFETLTSAMASGRTAQLKQLGLFVDSKAAVEAYAKAQGAAVSDLTDVDRAAALQTATLENLRDELKRNGIDTADFGDRIDRLKTSFGNFMDGLAEAIAASPVMAAGLDAIGVSLESAVGTDKQQLIQTLIGWVNEFAITVVQAGQIVADAALIIVKGLNEVVQLNAKIAETAAAVKFWDQQFQDAAKTARGQADAVAAATGAITTMKGKLDSVLPAMIAARDSQAQVTTETTKSVPAYNSSGDAAERNAARQKAALAEQAKAAAEYRAFQDMLGQREIENHAAVQAAKEAADAAYRAFQDEMGARELENHAMVQAAKEAADAEYRAFQDEMGKLTMEAQAEMYKSISEKASEAGFHTRAELQQTAETALATYEAMKESGLFTAQTLEEAWAKYEEARRAASEETKDITLDNALGIVSGTLEIFGRLGKAFKAAAIAGAIIATYQAIAKALAASPWPFNLIAAAGAAAAGWANVARIRAADEGWRMGTPNLDYLSFGRATVTTLHGDEAIIPRSRSGELAGDIAAALTDHRGGLSGQVIVNVDGRNSFYQNLGDMQRLADVVGQALVSQLGLTARLNPV